MPSPEKFKESLERFKVEEQVINEINEGYEELIGRSPKKLKAAYFKRAVDLLESRIGNKKLQEIFESNACCKGGAREKASKAFAKANGALSLEEKLEKIKEVPYMGKATINPDGTITLSAVSLWIDDKYHCACSNYNKVKRDYAVSKNYCFCCAGHFIHHYELMLGVKLETLEIVSSPLDSQGEQPCVMKFKVV